MGGWDVASDMASLVRQYHSRYQTDSGQDAVFPDIERKLNETIELFRKRGAVSPESALSPEELGLPPMFGWFMRSPMASRLPFVEDQGKFYLSEKKLEAAGDMSEWLPFPGEWLKHTARVPRGYLRYKVLQLLRDRPLSGSEIATTIGVETRGRWKPSPGSLYPLLKALLRDGFTEEIPDVGLVRKYRMTDVGRAFFEKQSDIVVKMRERLDSGPFPFPPFPELPQGLVFLFDDIRRMFDTLFRIVNAMGQDANSETVGELEKTMDSFTKELEQFADKVESQKHSVNARRREE